MKTLLPKEALAALTLARLRALNSVMETGSFSAAARRMAVSQATISQQVRDLERALSVELFKRIANDMVPTSLCQDIYKTSREIEDAGERIAKILSQHSTLEQGELRVGLGNPLPGMALIAAFQDHFPNVNVKIEMGSWSKIVQAVTEGRVDVAVLPDVPDQPRFKRRKIQSQSVVVIVHPQHPLAAQAEVTCRDLMQERLIMRTGGSSTQRVVDEAFKTAGLSPRASIVLDTRDGVLDAVAHRLGVGFMWNKGASRQDGFIQIPCRDMHLERADYVFTLRATKGTLPEVFFAFDRREI
jgi:LysR family transcriptional regulator, low CO2-responsive transcriptional regulator